MKTIISPQLWTASATTIINHDCSLIENSCQRFQFIQEQKLMEYLDIEEVQAQIEASSTVVESEKSSEPASLPNNHHAEKDDYRDKMIHEEDTLLEKLLELEAKLEADQHRKPVHQKPQLQAMWQDEIAGLKGRLGL